MISLTNDQLSQMFEYAQGIFNDPTTTVSDKLAALVAIVLLEQVRAYRASITGSKSTSQNAP